MIGLLFLAVSEAHSERAAERAPVAWALLVEGDVTRQDGSSLNPGEALEVHARLDLPAGASATVAHNGRLVRWEGAAEVYVGPVAVRVSYGETRLRQPHVEELGNALAGDIRAPSGSGQVVSALGIPLTAAAWARQDAIDGGALRALYRDTLADRLAAAGVDRALVAKLGLLDGLPGDGGEQVALIGRYLDLAGATPGAVLILEAPPTDVAKEPVRRHLGATLWDGVRGMQPHTFRVSEKLDCARLYARGLADALRRRGHAVYGVLVPYANTAENILVRRARPLDGVEHLHQLLVRAGGAESAVPTVAIGYSQGGAVVREYLTRYGDVDGLDFAVALATMGGADGAGAEGLWSGRVGRVRGDGVAALSVVHARDPAKRVHGDGRLALMKGISNFMREGRPKGDELALHMGYLGSTYAPLPTGSRSDAALAAGLLGYPTAYLGAVYDDLLAGRHDGVWARRGDWTWDLRVELPNRRANDFAATRVAPAEAAAAYRPTEPAAAAPAGGGEEVADPSQSGPAAPAGDGTAPTPAPSR